METGKNNLDNAASAKASAEETTPPSLEEKQQQPRSVAQLIEHAWAPIYVEGSEYRKNYEVHAMAKTKLISNVESCHARVVQELKNFIRDTNKKTEDLSTRINALHVELGADQTVETLLEDIERRKKRLIEVLNESVQTVTTYITQDDA